MGARAVFNRLKNFMRPAHAIHAIQAVQGMASCFNVMNFLFNFILYTQKF